MNLMCCVCGKFMDRTLYVSHEETQHYCTHLNNVREIKHRRVCDDRPANRLLKVKHVDEVSETLTCHYAPVQCARPEAAPGCRCVSV